MVADNQPSKSSTRAQHGPQTLGNAAREIAALIARLMSHYWTADDPPAAREAQTLDWIGDLIEFGAGTVSRACGDWRRTQSKRPTIADIRKLCIEAQSMQPSEQMLITGPNWRDGYARSVGFSSWLERQDAIADRQEAFRKAEEWRNSPEAQFDPAISGRRAPKKSPVSTAADLGVTATEEPVNETRAATQG